MLMSIVPRLYHTPHFLKERETGAHKEGSCPACMVKKDRERERSHAGHATQTSIETVMPGMKMNEMSRKKRAIE